MTQYGVCCCLPFLVYHFYAKGKNGQRHCRGLACGIYWELNCICLQRFWVHYCSPWSWVYGILTVGRFGQISLFLPFCAHFGKAYFHGARNLARKEGNFGSM